MIVGLPLQELRHTRAVQEILEEGRQEGREAGRQQEAAALAIRQLHRRFRELGPAASERIASLPLPRLEQLAEDLLDFSGPDDLEDWLENNEGV
jgi:predicted transposase YdaD